MREAGTYYCSRSRKGRGRMTVRPDGIAFIRTKRNEEPVEVEPDESTRALSTGERQAGVVAVKPFRTPISKENKA